MASSPRCREPALPSIRVPGPDRFQSQLDMRYGSSPAMNIPGIESRSDAPPPLPPPRHLPFGDAPFPHPDMSRDKRGFGGFGSGPGSGSSFAHSDYGSMTSSMSSERLTFQRRDYIKREGRDSTYGSISSSERSHDSLPAGFGLQHNKFKFQSPADLNVDSMKQKLNPARTLDKPSSVSLLSASASELLSRRSPTDPRFPTLSVPHQLPLHTRVLDSAHLTESPLYSALSPRTLPFHHGSDHRSPYESSEGDRSPRARSQRNNSDAASSTQGSYEFNGADDMDIDETSSLKRFHADDSYAEGQKRRAASQTHDDVGMHSIPVGSTRGSPQPRLTAPVQATSASTLSRSSSYVSTLSIAPSTTATGTSYDVRSPGDYSTGAMSPTSCSSPYATPMSLNPSPQASATTRASSHARTVSATSPRKIEAQKPVGAKIQGFFMCDCCPKKPKKFETREELEAHAAEKQYNCLYCGNRFKNKNEAERHQNSLHVRRQSWSCSALSGYGRAFHESSARPGEADTCGYCGQDFGRSGHGSGSGPRTVSDQDWDDRIQHLQEVHKFRECNSSKKFFRADHFRQHLKHSHAGTSGKWTNLLETACMIHEDPTPR